MSWRLVVYVVGGLVVVFYVLPSIVWRIARLVHRYMHPPTATNSLDAAPKARQAKD